MKHKRKLHLTRARIAVLVAIITCLENPPAAEGYRIRKISSVLKKHFEDRGEKLSGCMIKSVVDLLTTEKILRIADRSKLDGDRVESVEYEFNGEIFGKCEIIEVVRDTPKGRKEGKKVEVKGPERLAPAKSASAPSAEPVGVPDSIESAVQKIKERMRGAEERFTLAVENLKTAQEEVDKAREEYDKYETLLKNYYGAQQQLVQTAQEEE